MIILPGAPRMRGGGQKKIEFAWGLSWLGSTPPVPPQLEAGDLIIAIAFMGNTNSQSIGDPVWYGDPTSSWTYPIKNQRFWSPGIYRLTVGYLVAPDTAWSDSAFIQFGNATRTYVMAYKNASGIGDIATSTNNQYSETPAYYPSLPNLQAPGSSWVALWVDSQYSIADRALPEGFALRLGAGTSGSAVADSNRPVSNWGETYASTGRGQITVSMEVLPA